MIRVPERRLMEQGVKTGDGLRHSRLLRLVFSLLIISLLCSANATQQPVKPQHGQGKTDRLQYIAARKALSAGSMTLYRTLSVTLKDYILYPYLEIDAAQRNIDKLDADQVRELLSRHRSVPRIRRLRTAWLRRLSREKRWQAFLADYLPTRDASLRCAALKAELTHLKTDIPFDAANQDLWLYGESRGKICDAVFSHWKKRGLITESHHYQRARLAVQAGEARLARYLVRNLDAERKAVIERWIKLRSNPGQGLTDARHWQDTAANRDIIKATLLKLASSQNDLARRHWKSLKDDFAWQASSIAAIEKDIALFYATDYPDDALAVLAALPDAAVTQQIREWRVRVAVHQGAWQAVLDEISSFPAEFRSRDRWQYWSARALAELGQQQQSQQLFEALSKQANYYGFLAAERTGRFYALCPELRNADVSVIEKLLGIEGLMRAIELYHVRQLGEARSEWNAATRLLTREEKRHAAMIAEMEGWYDRATLTLADTGHWQQYQLRFPLAWQSLVESQARHRDLNPSTIYGVMRSESAMVTDAVSGADARGLMQLTLPTSRRVARKFQLPQPGKRSLTDVETNITLGSAHLAELFGEYRNYLKVLAAYNAGPAALKKWQKMSLPVEADRWIETVPYYETREYLTRVLAFATLYDWRREGKMIPLSTRMPNLDQTPGTSDASLSGSIIPVCPG